ncbi:MAG: YdcF family protein, partial [Novosphingobium sp.]|nr:YdcF family protein [Novosphingobium sp.]
MIRRFLAALFLVWAYGFLWFAVALPQPAGRDALATDAVVVPTGSGGRIGRGLEVLRAGKAKKMLVTGVDPEVKPREFAAEYKVESRLMRCCITLGSDAVDTRG